MFHKPMLCIQGPKRGVGGRRIFESYRLPALLYDLRSTCGIKLPPREVKRYELSEMPSTVEARSVS